MELGILITIVILIIASSSRKGNGLIDGDGNPADVVNINNVKMDSPMAQKVFDYYKKIILEKNLFLSDILLDVDLRREFNQIRKIEETLPDDDDLTYIDALSREILDVGGYHHNIILNPNEECLFDSKQCEVLTTQKVSSNISYAGFRFNNGGYRFGNITYHKEDFESFKSFDNNGILLLTNQRIIFKGGKRAKTINLGDIISIENYEKNGIIIFMKNREKPIILNFYANNLFYYNKRLDIRTFFRDVDGFYYAINKAFYKRLVPKDIQEVRKEADELNFLIARKTMIAEGLEVEENK